MTDKKILILILSCKHPVYQFLSIEGIDKTWNSIKYDNIPTYYYYGDSTKQYHDQNNIYLTTPENYQSITARTIEAFRYCLENFEFDYIYRTNNSSYINKLSLGNWLSDKPLDNFYSGIIGEYRGQKFASGCGYSISRDVIEKVLKNSHKKIRYPEYDDIAISEYADTKIYNAPRKDTECKESFDYEIDKYFHWRCKCPRDRNKDVLHMHNIHRLLTQKRKDV